MHLYAAGLDENTTYGIFMQVWLFLLVILYCQSPANTFYFFLQQITLVLPTVENYFQNNFCEALFDYDNHISHFNYLQA